MSSLLVWFFLIPAIGIVVIVVLVAVFAGSFVGERRRRHEVLTPPEISEDGHFYWNGRKWKPLP